MRSFILTYVRSIMIITLLSLFSSCQKEESANQSDLIIKEVEHKINAWLDRKNITTGLVQKPENQNLKNELEYDKFFQKKLKNGGKFIFIPLKRAFFEGIGISKSNSFTALQIIEDKSGNIDEGNLVQYTPENGYIKGAVMSNSFFQIYSDSRPEIKGEFSFLTITGKLIYKMEYGEDGLRSSGFVSPGRKGLSAKPEPDPIGEVPMCIDWYLVWVTYYPDGSTSQSEPEYQYTTCTPTSGGSGGSGSSNEEVYESVVAKVEHVWTFEVYPPNGPNTVGQTIRSAESFKGKRRANDPEGGYFTSITHKYSGLLSTDYGWWTEFSNSVNASGATASSQVSGRYSYIGAYGTEHWPGGDTKNFTFKEIFQ